MSFAIRLGPHIVHPISFSRALFEEVYVRLVVVHNDCRLRPKPTFSVTLTKEGGSGGRDGGVVVSIGGLGDR